MRVPGTIERAAPVNAARLFIALWPAPHIAQHLAQLTAILNDACGGRPVPQANQHITVAFLGNVDAARVADLHQVMRAAACASFELRLDKLEHRQRGGILWVRATQVPRALQALVAQLRVSLAASGFAVEQRVFVPHMTLLRDARKPLQMPLSEQLAWRVDELTLVSSHLDPNGAHYEVIFRAPLPG